MLDLSHALFTRNSYFNKLFQHFDSSWLLFACVPRTLLMSSLACNLHTRSVSLYSVLSCSRATAAPFLHPFLWSNHCPSGRRYSAETCHSLWICRPQKDRKAERHWEKERERTVWPHKPVVTFVSLFFVSHVLFIRSSIWLHKEEVEIILCSTTLRQ